MGPTSSTRRHGQDDKSIPMRKPSANSAPHSETGGSHLNLWMRPTKARSCIACRCGATSWSTPRSEEHTSELQSRGHLVCRLLLEKKKYNEIYMTIKRHY